jgi:FixJ family two-component response regulator
MKAKDESPIVYLVDDEEAVRDSLGMLFRSLALKHEAYSSALDFLQRGGVAAPDAAASTGTAASK